MAKSYFAILGVPPCATPEEVRSAYRRLAKEFHPDHYDGDSKNFRQVQEAYSVLGNPDRRKSYEDSLPRMRARHVPDRRRKPYPGPEPLIPEDGPVDIGEISPARSFETSSPALDEVFDWPWDIDIHLGHHKSRRVRHLTLEVPLTKNQAQRGGIAEVMVPAQFLCPTCHGYGNIGCYECHRCAGEGAIKGEAPVSIAFPPGIKGDHSVVVPLDRFGIRDIHLTVLFQPRGTPMR